MTKKQRQPTQHQKEVVSNLHTPWFIWRLVVEKIATLEEIETSWTIDNIQDAHDLLDCMS